MKTKEKWLCLCNCCCSFLHNLCLVVIIDLLPDKCLTRLGKLLLETFVAGNLQTKLGQLCHVVSRVHLGTPGRICKLWTGLWKYFKSPSMLLRHFADHFISTRTNFILRKLCWDISRKCHQISSHNLFNSLSLRINPSKLVQDTKIIWNSLLGNPLSFN